MVVRWSMEAEGGVKGEPKYITNKHGECEGSCIFFSLDCKKCWKYDMDEVRETFDDLSGRVIIKFKNTIRNCYRYPQSKDKEGNELEAMLEVDQYLSEKKRMPDPVMPFVSISYNDLKRAIDKNIQSWISTLSSAKGIYCITDTSNGKLYIGQAKNFWSRWCEYADNGHGKDVMLEELINKHGEGYARNWQFTVLERCGDCDENFLKDRENFWKSVFRTREHGYNAREGKGKKEREG